MKKLENFFEKKRLDSKFKKAGSGQKLNQEKPNTSQNAKDRPTSPRVQPTQSSQAAGQAALARLDGPKPADKKLAAAAAKREARRELEAAESNKTTQACGGASASPPPQYPSGYQDNTAPVSVSGIFYKCSLSNKVVPKADINSHIQECLLIQLAEDPIQASSSMIHTFNKDKEKVKVAVETIGKYIDNVCNNPGEEKYQKIRIGNKAFQERVVSVEGTEEYLQAVGFHRKCLPHQDTEEAFFVLGEDMCNDLDKLKLSKDILTSTEPVKPILDRDMKVLEPSSNAARFQLPDEFYNLTSEEVKKEQQLKSETVERNAELRTKAMRDIEEQRRMRRYRYTLLRIRFPDGIMLQGTFHARDKLSTVMEFVRSQLINDWQPFFLSDPLGLKLTEEGSTLVELKLAPAAVINFAWDAAIMAEIAASQGTIQQTEYLKPEVLAILQPV